MLDERRLARIRWRCRRGLLENDLILSGFLDQRAGRISEEEVAALDRLLEASDGELWDFLSGRSEPAEETVKPLLAALRSIQAFKRT